MVRQFTTCGFIDLIFIDSLFEYLIYVVLQNKYIIKLHTVLLLYNFQVCGLQ